MAAGPADTLLRHLRKLVARETNRERSDREFAGIVSTEVAGLVEGMTKAMVMAKAKLALVLVVALSLVGAGAGMLIHQPFLGKQTEIKLGEATDLTAQRTDQSKQEESQPPRTDRYGDALPPGAVARLGTLRLYHGQHVDRVLLSHDAKLVVSTAWDGGNRLWDAVTGRELPLQERFQHAFIFVWKDQLLAAQDGGHIWDLATGKEAPRPGVKLNARGVPIADGPLGNEAGQKVVSPDGSIRAVAEGTRIRLCETRTGKELPPLDKQQPSFEGVRDQAVNSLTFSPDGKLLASTHPGPAVRLWDLAKRREIRQFRGKDFQVFNTAFSADGKTLAGADGSSVTLWDVATGKWRHDFAHTYLVGAIAFTPDGKTLLTGSSYSDPVIRVWDPLTGRERVQWRGHTVDIQSLAISPDGKLAASCGQDRTLRLWEVATGRQVRQLGHQKWSIWSVAFSPDGKTLASADKMVHLWEVATGRELRSFGGGTVLRVAFSPDGKTLASVASDAHTVQVWEVASGKEVHQFGGHALSPPSIAFSPDGKLLATGDPAGPIHLWDTATRQEHRQLGGPMKPGSRSSYALGTIAFSPDGRSLAAGYSDETVRLWEVAAGQERARFHGHRSGVVSLAFSPDGTLLASGSWDRTVIVWDVLGQRDASRQHRPERNTKQMLSLWADLASPDAVKACQATQVLLTAGKQAVPLLKEQLRAAASGNSERIAQLLAELESDRFAVREKATRALSELGDQAEPAVRAALAGKPSPEARRRAEKLLEQLDPAKSPARLRDLRAVEVLEHVGTAQARKVLETLTRGIPEARLTQQAKAALERLAKRAKSSP